MPPAQSKAADRRQVKNMFDEAIAAYNRWDVESAVKKLQSVVQLAPQNASYHMSLAQALARAGDFDQALRSLANYLRLAPDTAATSRVEQLFASGMDSVEEVLTQRMKSDQLPLDMIGAAIQMWMEFQIALGEESLHIPKPETWAAALDYTVRKVNLHDTPLRQIAQGYSTTEETVRKHHQRLVEMLDIMPCDYRYFTGDENPLDKLVEASELLERLEQRFHTEE